MQPDPQDVLTVLGELRRNVDEIRARQLVGGHSILVRTNRTEAAADYSASVSGDFALFTISFTAERQDYALTELQLAVCIDSPTTPASLYDDYTLNVWRVKQPANPRLTTWKAQLHKLAPGTRSFYLKATVRSTDEGTLS